MNDWLEAESHADRALQMYERGRWAEAEAELRKALALNPHQGDWQFNLGLTLEAAGRDEEALAAFEQAVEMMPGQIEPLLGAGGAANRLGRYDAGAARFEQARRLDPRSEAAFAGLMESRLHLGEHEEVQTLHYLSQDALAEPSAQCLALVGQSLMEQKQLGRAGWCFRKALRIEPGMPRLRAHLAGIHAAQGKTAKAVQLYLRELRDDPGNVQTLLEFGQLLLELNRLPEAAEKFRRVLELDPANVEAHVRLGQTAMRNGRHEHARMEFELAQRLDPSSTMIRLLLAEALVRMQMQDRARLALQELAQQWRRNPSRTGVGALQRFGSMLLQLGLAQDAAAVIEHLAGRPDMAGDAALLRKLALAKYLAGDRAGGSAVSRRVLKLDRACVASMHNLALAAMRDGRLGAAAAWIARGRRACPKDEGLRRLRVRLIVARAARALRSLLGAREKNAC